MKIIPIFYVLFLLVFMAFPLSCFAKIGVGIGTGKIIIDEKLKAGTIYRLPSLTVVNTGDEESDYEVETTYHQDQPELMPPNSWFRFSPQKFNLAPGQVQTVNITLNLPLRAAPGNYFSYLEAHPVKRTNNGGTSVGVAAAAKLYFTVAPSGILEAVYYKIITFLSFHQPWTNRIAVAFAVVVLLLGFRKYFNIKIDIKK